MKIWLPSRKWKKISYVSVSTRIKQKKSKKVRVAHPSLKLMPK
jgi:hypothetical protein